MGRKPSTNQHLPSGMRARRRPSGLYYYYDMGGKPRKEIPLGTDYLVAVQKWAELEGQQTPKAAQATFDDAVRRYLVEVLPTKKSRTQRDNMIELEFLKEFFAGAPLADIEPGTMTDYRTWRREKARAWYEEMKRPVPPDPGHVRANRELALLSHIFNFARDSKLTNVQNPCAGTARNKEKGRSVYVEDEVFAKVYEQADQPTRDAMDLAYLTGQRPGDTLRYDERDINKSGELEIQQGKTEKKLRMVIEGELATVIARIRARKATYKVVSTALVVNERGQRLGADALRDRFEKARKKAGVKFDDFQFRDLRAKAGTDKTDAAGDIREAQKQLGHSSVVMTEHYVRQRRGDRIKPTK